MWILRIRCGKRGGEGSNETSCVWRDGSSVLVRGFERAWREGGKRLDEVRLVLDGGREETVVGFLLKGCEQGG